MFENKKIKYINEKVRINSKGKYNSKFAKTKCILVGQLKSGKSIIELTSFKGINIYEITIKYGKVRLSHNSYNPDGHTWSFPPGNKQRQHIDLEEGTHSIEIFVGEYYGKVNKVKLVNVSLFNNVQVEYSVKHIDI